jgi:hypothetical protein
MIAFDFWEDVSRREAVDELTSEDKLLQRGG